MSPRAVQVCVSSRRLRTRLGWSASVYALCSGLLACSGGASSAMPSGTQPPGTQPPGGSGNPMGGGPAAPTAPDPSASPLPADLSHASAAAQAEFEQLSAEVTRLRALDAQELLAEYPVAPPAELGYSPRSAEFMDRIQASALALDEGELDVLERRGFVLSSRRQFPSFLRGYAAIYMEHLPVYVSADALLEALHSSYDEILLTLESAVLAPELDTLLGLLLERTDALEGGQTRTDLQTYLEVARGLLRPDRSAGLSRKGKELVDQARAAQGIATIELFGVPRLIDFSQFTPRGHYTEGLEDYFRAMIWLGQIDFRLIESRPNGSAMFHRAQYEAMLALQGLLAGKPAELWSHIDGAVRAFVGESDSMTVPEIAELVDDLGGPAAALSASDAAVAAAIRDGGYGEQQIASYLMLNDGSVKTVPLNRSFLLFGQRYVADSHVFSQVVYDRIAERMLPDPLDAAFAALGNNHALRLDADLDVYPELPGALAGMRKLIDSHPQSFWDANLYNTWSSALRALSPAAGSSPGLPSVARSEAWGRRLLNTQLGSWAQLRHDTLLYAKQSYTGIPSCEFPDAYVEPYPAFFQALVRYAERGAEIAGIAASNAYLGPALSQYFQNLRSTATILGQMAEQQLTGTAHTLEQLAFINDAVRVEQQAQGCVVEEVPDGWYADLFFERARSLEQDPTIADVHTQPADEAGNIVGRVLHVGTGLPRLMTVTVDTCAGPRAYTGMAYAYHELVTQNFQRLTDETWNQRLTGGPAPAEVPWMRDLIAP